MNRTPASIASRAAVSAGPRCPPHRHINPESPPATREVLQQPAASVVLQQGVEGDGLQLGCPSQGLQLNDHQALQDVSLQPHQQLAGCTHRTSSCKQVIHNDHFLSCFHSIALDFEFSLAVLQGVGDGLSGAGEFPLLPDEHEANPQSLSQGGAYEEATGVQTCNDIDSGEGCPQVIFQKINQSLESYRILQQGADIT